MTCASCGQENPAEARFCANCGAALSAAAGAPPEEDPGVKGPDLRKRLVNSRNNRVFFGVAGGLSEYLGIYAALVRGAFVILSVIFVFLIPGLGLFAGLLTYLVLVFVMRSPERAA